MAAVDVRYDPQARYEVRAFDVEYRRDGDQQWLGRVYQPEGGGPFPALLDVHGGAWRQVGGRTQNHLIDQDLAESGLVVMSVDFRVSPEHPYPAQVIDVNYATRWLKVHARDFRGDAASLGGLGTSSGGHTIMLSAMRPQDPRYASLPLPEGREADASLEYLLLPWPVLDPYARYFFAQETGSQNLVNATETYFLTFEALKEGNPQLILERGEPVLLPPSLIIQPVPDRNIPRSVPERFVEAYRAAGGSIELEWFPEMRHGFAREVGEETNRALALMRAFIGRQLSARSARE